MDNVLIKIATPLTVIAVIFKLVGLIDSSWWLILSPLVILVVIDFMLYAIREAKDTSNPKKDLDKFITIKKERTSKKYRIKK